MLPSLRNIRLGRVFGIPIEMSPSWLITLSFFVVILGAEVYPDVLDDEPVWLHWLLAGLSGVFFCASIVFHELAHSLVARRFGIPVKSITLFMLGGVSHIARDAKRPLLEFLMAVAGPLSSVVLAGLFLAVALLPGVRDGRSAVMWEWLFIMNLALGVVNMAPGFPMDGGRVLRAAIWGATGNFGRATRWAALAGRGLGYALIGAGLLVFLRVIPGLDVLSGIWFIMVGLFLDGSARQASLHADAMEALRGRKAREVMRSFLPEISPQATVLEAISRHFDVQAGLCAFVTDDDGRAIGMITATQLEGLPKDRWATTLVRERMAPAAALPIARPDTDLAEVTELMDEAGLHHLPVLEDGRLVAYLSRARIVLLLREGMLGGRVAEK